MRSEQINELIAALAKAQGEMGPAMKGSVNPHFKSKYADLGSIWEACREPLSNHGLAVTQTMRPVEGGTELITLLGHSSGQWMASSIMLPIQKNGPQELGSCLSYCRRYALASMVGVYVGDDDDSEIAMKPIRTKVRLPVINDIQNEYIREWVKEFPGTEKSMLERYDVSSISDIPFDCFEEIEHVFNVKRRMVKKDD